VSERCFLRFARSQSGSNSVEFAILAPLLCLLLLGAISVGLLIGTAHSLAQIAADVSRYAMVGDTAATRRQMAETWLETSGRDYPLVDPRRMTLAVVEQSDLLRVSVTYDMSDLPIPDLVRQSMPVPTSLVRTAAVMIP
jgi:Flp pilus assembly protein TadG